MADAKDFGGHGDDAGLIEDNRQYFQERADWHRERARVAPDSSTRLLHERFATIYDARSVGDIVE
ncbi:hypothetical protein ASE75_01695 [Sphingomonas sp. Leaf17]|uniref:hypothetical protein n=1 Tax=Sphingomonas sp. Leaf17 TaxID=1735683 RepID=UPI0006F2C649|nr:hypothetical protein [Sphingomonas sp. Leaf17]KQM67669.1 hypothetical protein ASE75_01695 [Sphingomonas sp. Leaf17]